MHMSAIGGERELRKWKTNRINTCVIHHIVYAREKFQFHFSIFSFTRSQSPTARVDIRHPRLRVRNKQQRDAMLISDDEGGVTRTLSAFLDNVEAPYHDDNVETENDKNYI